MKDVFLIYDTSCFYEIAILNYFLQAAKCDVVLCSLQGKTIRAAEGYSVNADVSLDAINPNEVRSLIIPGGDTAHINCEPVKKLLRELNARGTLIAGICAGAAFLEQAGILHEAASLHALDADIVKDKNVIAARPNAYVDFAIAVAKELHVFVDEADLQETIDFWKYFKRVE